jgi:hypothetical protein
MMTVTEQQRTVQVIFSILFRSQRYSKFLDMREVPACGWSKSARCLYCRALRGEPVVLVSNENDIALLSSRLVPVPHILAPCRGCQCDRAALHSSRVWRSEQASDFYNLIWQPRAAPCITYLHNN